MSLEQSIQELTDAVKLLIAVFPTVRTMEVAAPEVVKGPKAKKVSGNAEWAAKTGDPVSSAAIVLAPAEVPNEQPKTTIDTSLISEPEFNEQLGRDPVTYDDVKKATNALSAAKGRDVTIDALSRFGVKRATELDEGQWADYIAYAETVIADE